MQSATTGDWVSAAPTAAAMNGARARGRHQRGQDAGEERRPQAVALGQGITDARETSAHFEHARQVEPHGEQQINHEGDEQRRLQLEAPADLLPARAQSRAARAASASIEAITPAANISPLARTAAGCVLACSTRPIALMDRTGNTQGIRFRISPPRTASSMSAPSPGVRLGTTAGLAGAKRGTGVRGGRGRATEGRSDLDRHFDVVGAVLAGRAALLGRNQNAADMAGARRLITELDGEVDGAVAAAQGLRRGVLDHAVVERIERRAI